MYALALLGRRSHPQPPFTAFGRLRRSNNELESVVPTVVSKTGKYHEEFGVSKGQPHSLPQASLKAEVLGLTLTALKKS